MHLALIRFLCSKQSGLCEFHISQKKYFSLICSNSDNLVFNYQDQIEDVSVNDTHVFASKEDKGMCVIA